VLPLNIKGASRFLLKWPSATLDIEPPEALWPETKGQAASLARVRGHPLHGDGRSQGQFPGQLVIGIVGVEFDGAVEVSERLPRRDRHGPRPDDPAGEDATTHAHILARVLQRGNNRPTPITLGATLGATGANDLPGFRTGMNNGAAHNSR
jgi:hypothetical protein